MLQSTYNVYHLSSISFALEIEVKILYKRPSIQYPSRHHSETAQKNCNGKPYTKGNAQVILKTLYILKRNLILHNISREW